MKEMKNERKIKISTAEIERFEPVDVVCFPTEMLIIENEFFTESLYN